MVRSQPMVTHNHNGGNLLCMKYIIICVTSVVLGVFLFTAYRGTVLYLDEARHTLPDRDSNIWRPNDPRGSDARAAYRGGEPPRYPYSIFESTSLGEYRVPPETKFIGTSTVPSFTAISDSEGFRVAAPRAAPGKVDILAIGGSQTWGQGIEYEQTYAGIVADRLGMILANAAVSGYGGVQSLRKLARLVGLRPKYIIYGLLEDHIYRNIEPWGEGRPMLAMHEGGGAFYIRQGGLKTAGDNFVPEALRWIKSDFLNAYFYQLKRDYVVIRAGRALGNDLVDRFNLGGRPEKHDPVMVPLMVHGQSYVLKRMNDIAKGIGARLIVVCFPLLPPEMPTPDEWKRLAESEGFDLIDIQPFTVGKPLESLTVTDSHYNAEVNRYMAERVLELIE